MGEILAEEAVQALYKAGTAEVRSIWLPAFCRSALSHLIPVGLQSVAAQTYLIFTIQDRGGSNSIGSSRITVLVPHTGVLETKLRTRLRSSLQAANGA